MLRNIFYTLIAVSCTLAGAAESAAPVTPVKPAASASTPAVAPKPAAEPSDLIRVGGSDLLQTAVGEPLARYVKQFHKNVVVDMLGSTPAIEGLKSGKIHLAIIAVPVGQNPAPAGLKAVPFCFSADYIIVNPENPLAALNLRQLSGIFGDSTNNIGEWGQLNLSGDWAKRPIVPYSTSLDDGVVIEMLKFLALEQKPLRGNVKVLNTPDEVFSAVKSSPNAIGLCGYDPGPPYKVLLISPDKTAGATKSAAAPTPANIASGEYPLRLPFYLVYNPANKVRVLELMRLLLSDAYAARLRGEQIPGEDVRLREAHFIPLPDAERSRVRDGLDKPD